MTNQYPYEIEVTYDKPLFQRAAWAYIRGMLLRNRRVLGVLLSVAGILLLILLALLGMMMARGCPLPEVGAPIRALMGVVAVLAVLVPLLYGVLYWRTVRNCEQLARKMADPVVRMGFGEEGFRFQSALASSEIHWKLFYKLQTGGDIWLLFPNAMTFYMLPAEGLSEELRGVIVARLREYGVEIKDI